MTVGGWHLERRARRWQGNGKRGVCKAFPVLGHRRPEGEGNIERDKGVGGNSASELLKVYKGVVRREMVC